MSVYTTPNTHRNIVPDTVETVVLDPELDILLWVEDAPTTPCKWDDFEGEPTAELTTAAARQEEPSEVDFMDAALADFRRNGCPGLHEDPNDTRMDYREARRPTF